MRSSCFPLIAAAVAWHAAASAAPPDDAEPAATARDAPPRVVLVRPADPRPWSAEMLVRAGGELRAAGFVAVYADAAAGEDPRATFRRVDPTAIAVISVAPGAAEVWVEDRLTGKISIRGAAGGDPRSPSDLAIEAVELLRASLIELTIRSRQPFARAEAPTAAVAFAEAALPPSRPETAAASAHARLGAGPTVFGGFDPAVVALAPSFELGLVSRVGLGGRVRFVGPTAGADLDAPGGAVSWSAWILSAGPTFEAALSPRWFVRGSLDVGLLHVAAQGDLASPAQSREGGALDGALLGGGAFGLRLTDHAAVSLGLEALVSAPPPSVVVGGETIATFGRPGWLAPLTLEVSP